MTQKDAKERRKMKTTFPDERVTVKSLTNHQTHFKKLGIMIILLSSKNYFHDANRTRPLAKLPK